jgi:hypothetical protein
MTQSRLITVRKGSIAVVLLFVCWLVFAIPPRTATTADITKPELNPGDVQTVPPNQPFLTGDERSIPVLKESLATLRQIDGRLERIEKLLAAKQQR